MAESLVTRYTREQMNALVVAMALYNEPTPLRAIIMLAIKIQNYRNGYCTFGTIGRLFDLNEKSVSITIGRLRGDGMVIEENGFIILTKEGKQHVKYLEGKRSAAHGKWKKEQKKLKK